MTPLEDPFPNPGSWRDPRTESLDKPLSQDRCLLLLAEMPPWQLGPSQAELVRTLKFPSRFSTLLFCGIVADFARETMTEPWLDFRGKSVIVRIGQPNTRPLNRRDFQLARRISLIEEPILAKKSLKPSTDEPTDEPKNPLEGDRES